MSHRLITVLFFFICITYSGVVYPQSYWISLGKPTTKNLIKECFIDSSTGWVAGAEGTILKTTNGGIGWTVLNTNITTNIRDVYFLNNRLGFAISSVNQPDSAFSSGTVILKTYDGGENWDTTHYNDFFFNSILFPDSLNGWMVGDYGMIVTSSNGGRTWETTTDSVSSRLPVYTIEFKSESLGIAIGGTLDRAGIVWRTTNGGRNWVSSIVSGEPLHGIHYVDTGEIICVGGDADYGSGIVRSSDDGATWVYEDLHIVGEATSLSFRTPSEGWVTLGYIGTMMYTNDKGRTWATIFTPDTTPVYDVQFTDERNGYMVGKEGTILKFNNKILGVNEHNSENLPPAFHLKQNYPNPFNPITVIGYSLSVNGFVSVKVYNLFGEEVSVLVNTHVEAGEHTVEWNAAGFPAGLYFYRLQSGAYSETRKLLLVK